MKTLVTGGSGMLGRVVVELLRGTGEYCFESRVDLREYGDVEREFKEVGAQCVVHCAGLVGGSADNVMIPGRLFYENGIMAMNVYEAARVAGVKRVVRVGSVCEYGDVVVPFREEDLEAGPAEGRNYGYGMGKRVGHVLSKLYAQQYGMDCRELIFANLYGVEDRSGHVIPEMIKKFRNKSPGYDEVIFHGDGEQTREFLWVEDAAEAVKVVAREYEGAHKVFNVGSGVEVKMRDLAEILAGMVGYSGKIGWDGAKDVGHRRRLLDSGLFRKETLWAPKGGFVENLKKVVG